jgi:truncated hemoglobin YjbI
LSDIGLHPLQSLETEALYVSGLSRHRAFAIDDLNIGPSLADFAFTRLMEAFFARAIADKDPEFSAMFRQNKELHMLSMAEYLLMRTGGPPVYAVRIGIPDLGRSHANLNITEKQIEKFIDHMEEAFHDCRYDFRDEYVAPILDFLRYQATLIMVYKRKQSEIVARGSLF